QDVTAFDRPLDAANQHNPALGCISVERPEIELALVQRDGERAVAEAGGTVDQIRGCMRNPVDRIVRRVGVKLDLEHDETPLSESDPRPRGSNQSVTDTMSPQGEPFFILSAVVPRWTSWRIRAYARRLRCRRFKWCCGSCSPPDSAPPSDSNERSTRSRPACGR